MRPTGAPELFAAAVDIVLGYGVKRAAELADDPATDSRITAHLVSLLSLPPQQRARIVQRRAHRAPTHPGNGAKPLYGCDFESRGALSPLTPRRKRH